MKSYLKWGWAVVALWLAASVGLFVASPDMETLVRDKGQISVPEGYSSSVADQMIEEMHAGEGNAASTIIVFHDENGLDDADLAAIGRAVDRLEERKGELGLDKVTSHFAMPELENRLVSEDGTTVLVALEVDLEGRTAGEAKDALYAALDDVAADHYLTGGWVISEDVIVGAQEGLKRTEWITVFVILVILVIVFRSPVAPLLPLATIGVSYLAAQSVVAWLVDLYNFPLSNFTQTFIVAIMFGIGTDYCILLISRFREELANGLDKAQSVARTYRTAGRTVLFSGIAVMAGISIVGLSEFILYRSAVGVAVGVAVLMISLYTVVPVFMYWLGTGMFWPSKKALEHKESKMWGAMGRFSTRRPLAALAIIVAVAVPLFLSYDGHQSYDSLDEIGDKYDSVKAFNIVAERFGPGEALPATVVARFDEPMDDADGLAVIERVSRRLSEMETVASVRSATRPTGEPIGQFQVASQAETLNDGLGEGEDGILQLRDGLDEAREGIASAAPQLQDAVDAAARLAEGTAQLKSGVAELSAGITRLEEGLRQGSLGANALLDGLARMTESADELQAAHGQLLSGYREAGAGIELLAEKYRELESGLSVLEQGLGGIDASLRQVAANHPELGTDVDFLTAQQTVAQLAEGAAEMKSGIGTLNEQLALAAGGIAQANEGYAQALDGQSRFASALGEIRQGLAELAAGIEQAADGQSALAGGVPQLADGLDQVAAGQSLLAEGMGDFRVKIAELEEGLALGTEGLTRVAEGIGSAREYLAGLQNGSEAGWYAPDEALENEDFKQALDMYMSADRKSVTWEVSLADHPYAKEALDSIDGIRAMASRTLEEAGFADALVAVGGVSSMHHDLDTISVRDYDRTVILMLAGIAIVLVVLLRSLVMPLYLVPSLLLTYFISRAVTEVIFVDLLGYDGVSWAVPFFGFAMLLALGVDYSIFLMDRFNEYKELPVTEAILLSMKKMGNVILSAAVILSGTFAAMLPSGVLSLLQVATLVMTGLFLYSFVIMPLFVPVMASLCGPWNGWPFRRGTRKAEGVADTNVPADRDGGVTA
jgi:RND superfamily putative drug exporter